MQKDDLQDLTEGENDWLNIQDVIRITFIKLNDIILKQQEEIANLKNVVQQLTKNQTETKEKVEDCYRILDSKIEKSDFAKLEQRVLVHLKQKVDKETVEQMLEQKADAVDMYNLLKVKANEIDVNNKLQQKADTSYVNKALESKLDKIMYTQQTIGRHEIERFQREVMDRVQHIALSVERKAEQDAVNHALDTKVDKSEFEPMKLLKASLHHIIKDCSSVTTQMVDLRQSVSESTKNNQAQIKEMMKMIENAEYNYNQQLKDTNDKFETKIHRLHQEYKNDFAINKSSIEEYKKRIERLIPQLTESIKESHNYSKTLKASITALQKELNELKEKLERQSIISKSDYERVRTFVTCKLEDAKRMCSTKLDSREVQQMIEQNVKHAYDTVMSKLQRIAWDKSETQKIMEEINDLHERVNSLQSLIDSKQDKQQYEQHFNSLKNTLQSALQFLQKEIAERNAAIKSINEALEQKVDTKDLNKWTQQHTLDENAILDKKANLEDLIRLKEIVNQKANLSQVREEILNLKERFVKACLPLLHQQRAQTE